MKKNLLLKFIFILFFIPAIGNSQVLFSETFSADSLPAGWTNDSLGMPARHLWLFTDVFGRGVSGAGFDSHYAIYDSDEGSVNDNVDENVALTTTDIDISSASVSLFLEFDQQYRGVTGTTGGTRVVEISTNGGTSWTMIDSSQSDIGYPNPAAHSVYDISSALPSASLKVRFHFYGSWDWWWAIDNVEIISVAQCTSSPAAGTSVSDLNNVCSSDTFNLSLNGEDHLIGISFQWQSSPDSTNWTNILNDTTEFVSHGQLTDTYYRCAVTCSGQTSYSIPVLVAQGPPTNCYCVGAFTIGCDILDKVVFNTLSNINSGCNGNVNNYINYPDTGSATTTIYADSTYDLIIASGVGSGNHGAGLWFDFDHNGDFRGANEFFHISDSIPELSSDFLTSITIPSNAFGTTRMKVRYVYNNAVTQTSDCASYGYGETEDYSIYILNNIVNIDKVLSENVKVYPSPASNYLNISVGIVKGTIRISMFDQTGRLCYHSQTENTLSQINVSNFSSGIYFLKVETKEGIITKKVVKD